MKELKVKPIMIDNKYYHKAKVIMLPTKDKVNSLILSIDNHLCIGYGEKLIYTNKKCEYRHLYITFNEEIKERNWFIVNNTIHQCIGFNDIKDIESNNGLCYDKTKCRKIMATTDTVLFYSTTKEIDGFSGDFNLLQSSQSFIDKYITEYNKGNVITDILVEYEPEPFWGNNGSCSPITYQLKVDKSNCITIKVIKDSYSKDEVIALFNKFRTDNTKLYPISFEKWIENNL